MLYTQGDLVAARPLYERALAIREKLLGPEHPATAGSLNDLASLLQDQGDLAGARPLYECALAISEKLRGPEHPDTATSLNNLAGLLRAKGDLVGAQPLYERALAKGARPRASRYSDEPQQSRRPASGQGRPCGGAAALRARAGDPREAARPRASRYGKGTKQSCEYAFECAVIGGLDTEHVSLLRIVIAVAVPDLVRGARP